MEFVEPLLDFKQETTVMSSKLPPPPPDPAKCDEMLTPKKFAKVLKVSLSWLAKARKLLWVGRASFIYQVQSGSTAELLPIM
jgi:hypothetical protein